MPNPWLLAGAAALGIIVAIGTLIHSTYRQHQVSPHQQAPNSHCIICGMGFRNDTIPLEFGCLHQAHRHCYRGKPQQRTDMMICPSCPRNYPSNTINCAVCEMPLVSIHEKKERPCGHLVHSECQNAIFVACAQCSRGENTTEKKTD